jgi:hypothetical protein
MGHVDGLVGKGATTGHITRIGLVGQTREETGTFGAVVRPDRP